jgi:phosphate/sulfate permease
MMTMFADFGIRCIEKAKSQGADTLKMILFGWIITLPSTAACSVVSIWLWRSI